MALKLMKIEENVKADLDSLKYYENESYTSVIKRLVEENKQLKEDKKQLYKLVLKTEDSVALVNNVHKATYFIVLVVNDVGTSEEEKLQDLKKYLSEMLAADPTSILEAIDILKDSSSEDSVELLVKFENYVKTSS